VLVRAARRVQQVILANHGRVGIREDWKGVPRFVGEITRNLRWVDANGYGLNPSGFEFREAFLYAS
jgi:hypothetical protein